MAFSQCRTTVNTPVSATRPTAAASAEPPVVFEAQQEMNDANPFQNLLASSSPDNNIFGTAADSNNNGAVGGIDGLLGDIPLDGVGDAGSGFFVGGDVGDVGLGSDRVLLRNRGSINSDQPAADGYDDNNVVAAAAPQPAPSPREEDAAAQPQQAQQDDALLPAYDFDKYDANKGLYIPPPQSSSNTTAAAAPAQLPELIKFDDLGAARREDKIADGTIGRFDDEEELADEQEAADVAVGNGPAEDLGAARAEEIATEPEEEINTDMEPNPPREDSGSTTSGNGSDTKVIRRTPAPAQVEAKRPSPTMIIPSQQPAPQPAQPAQPAQQPAQQPAPQPAQQPAQPGLIGGRANVGMLNPPMPPVRGGSSYGNGVPPPGMPALPQQQPQPQPQPQLLPQYYSGSSAGSYGTVGTAGTASPPPVMPQQPQQRRPNLPALPYQDWPNTAFGHYLWDSMEQWGGAKPHELTSFTDMIGPDWAYEKSMGIVNQHAKVARQHTPAYPPGTFNFQQGSQCQPRPPVNESAVHSVMQRFGAFVLGKSTLVPFMWSNNVPIGNSRKFGGKRSTFKLSDVVIPENLLGMKIVRREIGFAKDYFAVVMICPKRNEDVATWVELMETSRAFRSFIESFNKAAIQRWADYLQTTPDDILMLYTSICNNYISTNVMRSASARRMSRRGQRHGGDLLWSDSSSEDDDLISYKSDNPMGGFNTPYLGYNADAAYMAGLNAGRAQCQASAQPPLARSASGATVATAVTPVPATPADPRTIKPGETVMQAEEIPTAQVVKPGPGYDTYNFSRTASGASAATAAMAEYPYNWDSATTLNDMYAGMVVNPMLEYNPEILQQDGDCRQKYEMLRNFLENTNMKLVPKSKKEIFGF